MGLGSTAGPRPLVLELLAQGPRREGPSDPCIAHILLTTCMRLITTQTSCECVTKITSDVRLKTSLKAHPQRILLLKYTCQSVLRMLIKETFPSLLTMNVGKHVLQLLYHVAFLFPSSFLFHFFFLTPSSLWWWGEEGPRGKEYKFHLVVLQE